MSLQPSLSAIDSLVLVNKCNILKDHTKEILVSSFISSKKSIVTSHIQQHIADKISCLNCNSKIRKGGEEILALKTCILFGF